MKDPKTPQPETMTYPQAMEFLYGLQRFGAKFGLENVRQLAALAGNPHARLRFIHIAGTNGKGSTCAMLEGIYRAAGLRVGLFTSPHLVAFGERIQVNRENITQAGVSRLVAALRGLIASATDLTDDFQTTLFEFATVMALLHFAERQCDLVIWETGLGGRLDATNIVTPLASVITNEQFDHQQWLGDTLAKIAFEKAGIIKHGIPVITSATAPEALAAIVRTASQSNAPLTLVTDRDTRQPPLDLIRLPLPGEHQRWNAALAVATVRTLAASIPVSDEAIRTGLENVHWPGRLQIVRSADGRSIVFDGAHNPAGAEALRAALAELFPEAKPVLVLGAMRDKDWAAMCGILAPLAARVLIAPVKSDRSALPDELRTVCAAANPGAVVGTFHSLRSALEHARGETLTVVTGSLQFIGEAMELLGVVPEAARDERGLNDWTATGPAAGKH